MNRYKKNASKVVFSVLTGILCITTYAQKQPDAGIWATFTVEKDFTKKLTVGVDQEMRLRENYSRLNLFYTNPYVIYKVQKRIKLGLGYRFISKYMYQTNSFSYRNRLMFDIAYKNKFKDVVISYRSRLQGELRDYNCDPQGKMPEYFWRNKFELGYDYKKITPYIGTELRYQIIDPRNPRANYGWHRARTYAGVDYDMNKKNTFGIMYLIQQEFDLDDPGTGYILGLSYKYTL